MSNTPGGANPQTEDGHLRLANELVEALARTPFDSMESQIIWTIFRQTYGWAKKEDAISLSQFEEKTQRKRKTICEAIKRLQDRCIINVRQQKDGKRNLPSIYGINKHYDKWVVSPTTLPKGSVAENTNSSVVHNTRVVSPTTLPDQSRVVSSTTPTIESKEINTKDNIKYNDTDRRLTDFLDGKVRERYPWIKEKRSTKKQEEEYLECNKLHRIDGIPYEMIEFIANWSQEDEFWKQNIRSMTKLRKHFDALMVKAKGQYDKKKKKGVSIKDILEQEERSNNAE
jgi:phage replication O-like protein O